MERSYVFSSHGDDAERRRLQALERVHDPRTFAVLQRAGLAAARRCAEVGAGAGSILRHMAGALGPGGAVTALDLDPRFLDPVPAPGIAVRQGDLTDSASLEPGAYDLVHARFTLLHVADPAAALRTMARALRPGGALVLEEPDFRTAFSAAPDPRTRTGIEAVNRAICRMYERIGRDPGLGLRLPALVRDAGLELVEVDVHTPLAPGGSDIALMMRASVRHLAERLLETATVYPSELAAYDRAAADPAAWASYYATVSLIAHRPT